MKKEKKRNFGTRAMAWGLAASIFFSPFTPALSSQTSDINNPGKARVIHTKSDAKEFNKGYHPVDDIKEIRKVLGNQKKFVKQIDLYAGEKVGTRLEDTDDETNERNFHVEEFDPATGIGTFDIKQFNKKYLPNGTKLDDLFLIKLNEKGYQASWMFGSDLTIENFKAGNSTLYVASLERFNDEDWYKVTIYASGNPSEGIVIYYKAAFPGDYESKKNGNGFETKTRIPKIKTELHVKTKKKEKLKQRKNELPLIRNVDIDFDIGKPIGLEVLVVEPDGDDVSFDFDSILVRYGPANETTHEFTVNTKSYGKFVDNGSEDNILFANSVELAEAIASENWLNEADILIQFDVKDEHGAKKSYSYFARDFLAGKISIDDLINGKEPVKEEVISSGYDDEVVPEISAGVEKTAEPKLKIEKKNRRPVIDKFKLVRSIQDYYADGKIKELKAILKAHDPDADQLQSDVKIMLGYATENNVLEDVRMTGSLGNISGTDVYETNTIDLKNFDLNELDVILSASVKDKEYTVSHPGYLYLNPFAQFAVEPEAQPEITIVLPSETPEAGTAPETRTEEENKPPKIDEFEIIGNLLDYYDHKNKEFRGIEFVFKAHDPENGALETEADISIGFEDGGILSELVKTIPLENISGTDIYQSGVIELDASDLENLDFKVEGRVKDDKGSLDIKEHLYKNPLKEILNYLAGKAHAQFNLKENKFHLIVHGEENERNGVIVSDCGLDKENNKRVDYCRTCTFDSPPSPSSIYLESFKHIVKGRYPEAISGEVPEDIKSQDKIPEGYVSLWSRSYSEPATNTTYNGPATTTYVFVPPGKTLNEILDKEDIPHEGMQIEAFSFPEEKAKNINIGLYNIDGHPIIGYKVKTPGGLYVVLGLGGAALLGGFAYGIWKAVDSLRRGDGEPGTPVEEPSRRRIGEDIVNDPIRND